MSCVHIIVYEEGIGVVIFIDHIVPLEPELAMSTPIYDPFGTETTYKSKLFLCQMGHKQKWT